jgi:hypothetical protein
MDAFAGLGIELAKPVVGGVTDRVRSQKETQHFHHLIEEALQQSGLNAKSASTVADQMMKKVSDASKEAVRGRFRRVTHGLRRDRGPKVERLGSKRFAELLDEWYQQSVGQDSSHAATMSAKFFEVAIDKADSFDEEGDYAKRLLDAVSRNDERLVKWRGPAAIAGGLAATGTAAALADGVHGVAELDLKTALTVIIGLLLTLVVTSVVGPKESSPENVIVYSEQSELPDQVSS